MNNLEELKQLLATLRKYDLPVSPILEYAINEKINQFISNDESSVVDPISKVQTKDRLVEHHVNKPERTKRRPSTLHIIRSDGSFIESETSANGFCIAIKELGVEKVFDLKIPMDNMHLVTKGGNPQYPTAQHDVGNGFFVNVHSNTITKKRQLERIFKALDLNWKVEIVESK